MQGDEEEEEDEETVDALEGIGNAFACESDDENCETEGDGGYEVCAMANETPTNYRADSILAF